MVDQREVYAGARDRSGTHVIVTTHFLSEAGERRVACSSVRMLLSEAFGEQDTAIKTRWIDFWEEKEEIIRESVRSFGQQPRKLKDKK